MTVSLVHRSFHARLLHAVLFEGIAIVLCAPTLAWLLDKSVTHTGLLTLAFSLVAMMWNVVFNFFFDHLQQRLQFTRDWCTRTLHAMSFEAGLVVMLVPLAAWWLSIGLWEAFLLDLGLLLFFLPYTLGFNWLYDLGYDAWRRRVGDADYPAH